MIETYRDIGLIVMGILCIGSPVEVVNSAILFEIHFTRMVGSLCGGAHFVVCVWSVAIYCVSGVPRDFVSAGGGEGSTNSVEDRENGDLGAVAP